MGMDLVELVMAFEEAFDVVITDECTERMLNVGDAHQALLGLLAAKGTRKILSCLRADGQIIVEHIGVAPEEVVPEARFVEDLRID